MPPTQAEAENAAEEEKDLAALNDLAAMPSTPSGSLSGTMPINAMQLLAAHVITSRVCVCGWVGGGGLTVF